MYIRNVHRKKRDNTRLIADKEAGVFTSSFLEKKKGIEFFYRKNTSIKNKKLINYMKTKIKTIYSILKKNVGKVVLVNYKTNGKTREDLMFVLSVAGIESMFSNHDGNRIIIKHENINFVVKKQISFMSIKAFLGPNERVLNPQRANLITSSMNHIIQLLKNEEGNIVQTRTALFSRNGGIKKTKKTMHDLELATYKMLDTKKRLLICPIIIVNNHVLVAISHDGTFTVIDSKGETLSSLSCQDFIVEANEEIRSLNKKNLTHLAQTLL